MTISGIRNPYGITPDVARPRERADTPVRDTSLRPQPATVPQGVLAGQESVPAEAPQGTDPALWQVLTPEERSFFARARTMGPLTYSPRSATDARMAGVAQGGRIDVRV